MGIFSEFKSFINRGSVTDLAVGVVIGSAFGKIVNSLVTDIMMPPLGFLIGGINFTEIKLNLNKVAGADVPVTLNIGNFIQTLVEFVIISMAIFLVIKMVNRMRTEEPAPPPAGPSAEEKLLTEIRDLLKK